MTHPERASSEALPPIMIPAGDYDRLSALAGVAPSAIAAYLERELARATIIDDATFGATIARVGSRITYRDETTGRTRTVTLTWPESADITRERISVLSSIGAALLGMQPNGSIDWPAPLDGPRRLTVLAVENSGTE